MVLSFNHTLECEVMNSSFFCVTSVVKMPTNNGCNTGIGFKEFDEFDVVPQILCA